MYLMVNKRFGFCPNSYSNSILFNCVVNIVITYIMSSYGNCLYVNISEFITTSILLLLRCYVFLYLGSNASMKIETVK